MPDIRDVLNGLSIDDRALYTEIRTAMRRSYLSAHSKLLHIDKYEATDDAFLDLIDIKLATLFDRGGMFDNAKGSIDTEQANEAEKSIESAATRLMKNDNKAASNWPVK